MLAGVSAAMTAMVAGCSALQTDEPAEDQQYTALLTTAVYVADDAELSIPEEIQTVNAANNADLIVVPDDTDVDAEQAVEWLADGRAIAVLGDGSEATWLAWAQSDPFADAFDQNGLSDSEPDPYLLVAAADGLKVPTYRRSWGDGPRDRDVLHALDEILADVDTPTSDS